MIKRNKWHLILSSLVILIPLFLAIIFPRKIAAFFPALFGQGNGADVTFFFVFPLILFAVQWLCVLITCLDSKSRNQTGKLFPIVLWIIPAIMLITMVVFSSMTMGGSLKVFELLPAFFGILFIVIGNYLPKTRQNHTMGMKIKWTLEDEENWFATHRLAGKLFVVGGVVVIIATLFSLEAALIAVLAVAFGVSVASMIYSYRFYKKQLAAGKIEPIKSKPNKVGIAAYICGTVVLIAVLAAVLVGGEISCSYDYPEEKITIHADYYQDISFLREDVESVELCDNIGSARRIMGYGSPKMSLGTYQSDIFGAHTRYTYNANPVGIVVKDKNGAILVFNLKTAVETKEFFNSIFNR